MKKIDFRLYAVLLAVNVVLFFASWIQAGNGNPTIGQLRDWGANYAPLTLTGEPWRLVSSAFLHASWIHLLLNMYMLFIMGSVLERIVGAWRFGAIYLLSALGGSLLSACWNGYHEVAINQYSAALGFMRTYTIAPATGVGASGALMGLVGAAGALVLRHREGWPPGTLMRISGKAIAQVIVINLVFGAMNREIDQSAHIGGLALGFIAGLALFHGDPSTSFFRRVGVPVLVAALGSALMFYAALHAQTPALLALRAHLGDR